MVHRSCFRGYRFTGCPIVDEQQDHGDDGQGQEDEEDHKRLREGGGLLREAPDRDRQLQEHEQRVDERVTQWQ